jgi:hypothetical protein
MSGAETQKALTKADAAKLVKREIPLFDDNKKPTGKTKLVAIAEDEVLDFAEREDGTVVVVTKDGQKFFGETK